MKKIFFFFLICASFLFSVDPDARVIVEDIPRICDCIDPISGSFVYHAHDLTVIGAEPIYLQRSYFNCDELNSDSKNKDGGWSFFPHLKLYPGDYTDDDKTTISSFTGKEPNGVQVYYKFLETKEDERHYGAHIDRYSFGFRNSAFTDLSGRTNVKNNKLVFKNNQVIITTGDGTLRIYEKKKENYYDVYCLKKERKPNGNVVVYEYVKDKNKTHITLKSIETKNTSETQSYARIDFSYFGDRRDKNHDFDVIASNGLRANYRFWRPDQKYIHNFFYLSYITGDLLEEKFLYDTGYKQSKKKYYDLGRAPFINSIQQGNNKILELNYYYPGINYLSNGQSVNVGKSGKDECNRVKTLSLPYGENGALIPAYSLVFNLAPLKRQYGVERKDGSFCQVSDLVTGYNSVYRFSGDFYLNEVIHHSERGSFNETYEWEKNGHKRGDLKSKTLKDQSPGGQSISYLYEFDDRGNVIQETFRGDLTGHGNPNEQYCRCYCYNDLNLPVRKEEDNGLVILYSYKDKTNLLTSKIISDKNNNSFQRFFFEYNDDNILIRKTEDDGRSKDLNDISNVSIRRITKIFPKAKNPNYIIDPALHLPEVVEEYYLDPKTLEEIFLKREVFVYSHKGQIVCKNVYGQDRQLSYSVCYSYNNLNLLTEECDSLGRRSYYTYDSSQRPLSIKKGNSNITENFTYDDGGRLIQKEEIAKNGDKRIYHYSYDKKNNRNGEMDFRDALTSYLHDSRGYVCKKTLPSISDENENMITYCTYHEHDGFGRETAFIDTTGAKTIKHYNAYGKVTGVSHPDNTHEYFYYNLDGTLQESVDQEGVHTYFTYDAFGRESTKKIVSQSGELLLSEEKIYNGFEMESYKNADGNLTYYFYDGAGRKIAEEFHHDIVERKEYEYDLLGRQYKTVTCNRDKSLIEIKIMDSNDRVLEERKEDVYGNILTKIEYEYDNCDNRITEIKFVDDKRIVTSYQYDPFNRLIRVTDQLGQVFQTEYQDFYTDKHNKRVLKRIKTDPLGVQTIEVFDHLGNIVSMEKKNIEGKKLALEKLFYDGRNNLLLQESEVISKDGVRFLKRKQIFDEMGRLVSLIEAAGTKDERLTSYAYTSKGQLFKTVKPDQTAIQKSYDPLGREVKLESSDGSCRYSFEYTTTGHLIKAIDLNTGKTTLRSVDGQGRVLSEKLANDQIIFRKFDFAGRCIETRFSDGSSKEKEYDALFLKKVIRKDNLGHFLYEHSYDKYDLSGNLLQESLIRNLGAVSRSFDELGRPGSVFSSYLNHTILGYDAVSDIKRSTINGYESRFDYDDLQQLIKEEGLFSNEYAYDSHYNRLRKNDNENRLNDLNELIGTSQNIYRYDNNGNTIFKKDSRKETSYYYDALDRLIKVVTTGEPEVNYTYDSFHRRLGKTTSSLDGKITEVEYIYDDRNEIGEIEDGRLLNFRVLGDVKKAEISSAISIETCSEHGCELSCPLHDLFGNVAALINIDNKTAFERYYYSAFGEEKIFDLHGKELSESSNPWRFSSKRQDPETSFIYFGRRYYDPDIGRWVTTDPKGYSDGLNLYAYLLNDPLTKIDLYGLFSILAAPSLQLKENDIVPNGIAGATEAITKCGMDIVDNLSLIGFGMCCPVLMAKNLFTDGSLMDDFRENREFMQGLRDNVHGVTQMLVPGDANSLSYKIANSTTEIGIGAMAIGSAINMGVRSFTKTVEFILKEELGTSLGYRAGIKTGKCTENNYRINLKKTTGINPSSEIEAHHVFPQKHQKYFLRRDVNVHDPKYLTWWERSPHRRDAWGYNEEWKRFIRDNPNATKDEYLQKGRELMKKRGIEINY